MTTIPARSRAPSLRIVRLTWVFAVAGIAPIPWPSMIPMRLSLLTSWLGPPVV